MELGEPQGAQVHAVGTLTPTPESAMTVHDVIPASASPPPQPEFMSLPPNVEEYLDVDTNDIRP
jgi:hypothetical protein